MFPSTSPTKWANAAAPQGPFNFVAGKPPAGADPTNFLELSEPDIVHVPLPHPPCPFDELALGSGG